MSLSTIAGEASEREIERHRGVGADHALDRGMRNVAFVPERDVLERRRYISAHHARQPDQVFRQHRIALVRHGRRAFLAFGEILLRLQNLGALQMADLGRQPLDRAGDHAERGEVHGMAIARNDLGGDRLHPQPHLLRHIGFDPRIDLGEGADRPGNRAGRDFAARRREALSGAGELGVGIRELEPEGGGLGMDAVRAADGRGELVLAGAALERGVEFVDVGDEQIGGAHQLDVETGVEHVGRRHPLMHETRFRTDDFRQMGEEGDDIVLDLALDLVDAGDVERGVLALGPDFCRRLLRDDAEISHGIGGVRLDLEPGA